MSNKNRSAQHSYVWYFIGVAALLTFALGIFGYDTYGERHNLPYTLPDLLYKTLQLFALNFDNLTHPIPWSLELARFLAPALVALSAFEAAIAIFNEQYQFVRAGRTTNHIVICGLGRKGWLLASTLKASGKEVVVIEPDRDNLYIRQARRLGIPVLIGNANDKELLRQAGAGKAISLFAVCGEDETNAEVAIKLRALVGDRKGKRLDCFIHIKNIALAGLLKEREIVAQRPDAFHLEIFNIYDRGARLLLTDYAPFANQPQPHLLVVGLGALGQSLVIQAAKRWIKLHGDNASRFSITLVDPDAPAIVDRLNQTYPSLPDYCRLIALPLDIESNDFQHKAFPDDDSDSGSVTQIFICQEEDYQSITSALALRQLAHHDIPIIVQMSNGDGLASLIKGELTENTEFNQISIFNLLERACTAELLTDGTNEIIARALHENYVEVEKRKGKTVETNSAMAPWESLAETWKTANYRHADHIGEKLLNMDCKIVPLKSWNATPFTLTPDEIEAMAEQEHERWEQERKEDGWSYAEGEKDEKRKTSPHMIPWNKLSDEIKEYDREFVRNLPLFLAQVGFEIVRKK